MKITLEKLSNKHTMFQEILIIPIIHLIDKICIMLNKPRICSKDCLTKVENKITIINNKDNTRHNLKSNLIHIKKTLVSGQVLQD